MKAPVMRPGERRRLMLGPWDAGIDEKTEAGQMANNQLRAAVNVLLDEVPGKVVKCFGNKEIGVLPSGLPPKYGYNFKKSDGSSVFLLADGTNLYYTSDLVTLTLLRDDLDPEGYLQFETAEDKCWIFNGEDDVFWFDGLNMVVLDSTHVASGTTDAGTDQTHIVDSERTEAASDFWKHYVVVITSGTYAGMAGRVTAFDPALDKLTISGFTANPGSGVTYQIGVAIPKGRAARFINGTMFVGGLTENRSAMRFNRLDDPDTGYQMEIDNPRAWPAIYQLAVTQDDGDQIWSFSPVYRSRILVSKGTAIYRIEPDVTFKFVPIQVTREVGCRYPDSWAVKNDLLHFVGNERSGLLDLYVTDMVSVKPLHKDGRLLPSFAEMQRADPVYKYIARASAAQFETGEYGKSCKVSGGKIEARTINTNEDWQDIKDTLSSVDQSHDKLALDMIPAWEVNYNPMTKTGGAGDPNDLPAAADPAWTLVTSGPVGQVVQDYGLYLYSSTVSGGIGYDRYNVLDAAKNTFASIRFMLGTLYTAGSGYPSMTISIGNGSKRIQFCATFNSFFGNQLWKNDLSHGPMAVSCPAWYTDLHTLSVLLDKNGNYKLWLDGTLIDSGAGVSNGTNRVHFGLDLMETNNGGSDAFVEKMSYDSDFAYDCTTVPASIPTTGTAVVKYDFKLEPAAYGKLWAGIDANGGSVTIETASSADGVTYSAYAALTNGQEPGVDNATPVKQHLKVKFTLTRDNPSRGPVVNDITIGFLWHMLTAIVGPNITAWRKWLEEATVPSGTTILRKIRLATTLTTPAEGDFGAWQTITDNQNVGTILSDVIPETGVPAGEGRWVDVMVQGKITTQVVDGVTLPLSPSLDNFLINWQEGKNTRLTVTALIYKKRLYITGISANATYNDRLLVLDSRNSWTKMIGLNFYRMIAFNGNIYGLSSADDKIYQQEVEGQFTNGTTPIEAYIDVGEIDFGMVVAEVQCVELEVSEAQTIQIYLSRDGVTWTLKGTAVFTAAGAKKIYVPAGWMGRKHWIRAKSSLGEAMGIINLNIQVQARAEVRI